MTNTAALNTVRFFEEDAADPDVRFIPDWEELHQIVLAVLDAPGYRADLARFCVRAPHLISRYFHVSPKQRRQPDGEVALATLAWLTRKRLRWLSAVEGETPLPPPAEWRALEKGFDLEVRYCKRRIVELSWGPKPAPGMIPMWDDLFEDS